MRAGAKISRMYRAYCRCRTRGSVSAGARDLQQAQAPAGGASKPIADLLFVLSAQKVRSLRLRALRSTARIVPLLVALANSNVISDGRLRSACTFCSMLI